MSTLAGGYGSTTFGYANGQGTQAKFNNPFGVAVDASGNVFVADSNNAAIRKISATGGAPSFRFSLYFMCSMTWYVSANIINIYIQCACVDLTIIRII